MAVPTIAERARTTAASAVVADLITYARRPGGPGGATVPVAADHRGRPRARRRNDLSCGCAIACAARWRPSSLPRRRARRWCCMVERILSGAHTARAPGLPPAGRECPSDLRRRPGDTGGRRRHTRRLNPIRCAMPRRACSRTWRGGTVRNCGAASVRTGWPTSSSSSPGPSTGTGWSCWPLPRMGPRLSGCRSRRR